MLRSTYIHIQGIGEKTERKLWRDGFVRWENILERQDDININPCKKTSLIQSIDESLERLYERDAEYFDMKLTQSNVWRLYPEFKDRCAFLDIETTGLGNWQDHITLIGIYDGEKEKVFIHGENMHRFPEEIGNYKLLVTYNGKSFDLPFIKRSFPEIEIKAAHIDLRYLLARLGLKGGLKGIESKLGIARSPELSFVNGYYAVLLWQRHLRKDRRALDALIRYNLEDVVNLKFLMEKGYNMMLEKLPVDLPVLQATDPPIVDHPFDPEILFEIRENLMRKYTFERY